MDVDPRVASPAAETSAQGAAAAAAAAAAEDVVAGTVAAAAAAPHATSVNRRYPIPPPTYTLFTAEAWEAYQSRKGKEPMRGVGGGASEQDQASDTKEEEKEDLDVVLTDEQLEAFEPPRVDWIAEDGGWQAFGQTHAVQPHVFTSTDLGIPDFRPLGVDISPKDHLLLLLRSYIHTTLLMLKTLSTGSPPTHEVNAKGLAHRTAQHVEHLANLAGTMMTMTNELRPIQARLSVERMLRSQLEQRRAETEALKAKTHELARRVGAIKERAALMAAAGVEDGVLEQDQGDGVVGEERTKPVDGASSGDAVEAKPDGGTEEREDVSRMDQS